MKLEDGEAERVEALGKLMQDNARRSREELEAQLAEMRQQMSYVRNCIEDQAMDAQFKSELLWDIDQALAGHAEQRRLSPDRAGLREALKVALQARHCVRFSAEWDRAWGIVEKALSAAPAGGQVLYRGKHSVYVDPKRSAEVCLVPIRLGKDADVEQGEQLIVTVYKPVAEQGGE